VLKGTEQTAVGADLLLTTYLTSNLAPGHVLKFLLKDQARQQSAQQGVRHYQAHWERLEELSQINAELLRRGDPLEPPS